jgi:hypothetical protein
MMHGTQGLHGFWGMNGFGSITILLIWTLIILGIIYLYQKITEE